MSTMNKLAHILNNNTDVLFEIIEEIEEHFGSLEDFFTCHIENTETYNKFISNCFINYSKRRT